MMAPRQRFFSRSTGNVIFGIEAAPDIAIWHEQGMPLHAVCFEPSKFVPLDSKSQTRSNGTEVGGNCLATMIGALAPRGRN